MPDPLDFDAAAASVLGDRNDVPEEEVNPFDEAAKQVTGARRQVLATSMQLAKQANPDTRAKAMELAKIARLPINMVEDDIEGVAATVRREVDPDTLRRDHPDLADWLSHPDRAAISNDDLPVLRQLDVAARSLRGDDPTGILPPGYLYQGDKIIRPIGDGSMADQFDSLEDLAKDLEAKGDSAMVREIQSKMNAERYDKEYGWAGNVMAGAAQSIQANQRALGTRTEYDHQGDEVIDASVANAPGWFGDVQRGVGGLIADAPLMLAGGPVAKGVDALTRLTRARAAVSNVIGRTAAKRVAVGAQVAGASQPLAIREGLSEADEHGATDGALAWLVESAVPGAFGRTGVERIIVPGSTDVAAQGWRGAVKRLITDAGMEATEEAVTEWAHAVREAATGADPTALDPDKLWRRLTVAGAVGGVAGGAFSLPATIGEKFAQDGEEARRASVHAERLDGMVDMLAESKTNGRAPGEIAAGLDTTLGQSNRHLFVDAEQFRDAFQDPAAAAAALGVSKEYTSALATGGQVQVSTVSLLQRAATDEQFRKLIAHARRAPTARTASEADEFQAHAPDALKQLQNEAKAATAEAGQETTDHDKQVADIEDNLVERLNAVSPEHIDRGAIKRQAKVVASAIGALAKRSGKSPQELFTLKLRGDTSRLMRGERFDLMDAMIERLRKGEIPTDREAQGPSLVDFLRTKGIADKVLAGELKSLAESDRTRKPGERNLVRDDGIDLDTAAQAAQEAGYIEEATPNALLTALDTEVRSNSPAFSTKGGNPEAQAARESLSMLADAIRDAGGDISASNKDIRKALADLEDRAGTTEQNQGAAVVDAPKSNRLDVDALLKQWRKATGDRTPIGGIEAWEQLVEESAKVDGQELNQPAYHGTPHKFDKFTTDHMGTGEGAQAFGWGLYFAGKKEIAEWYRESIQLNRGPRPYRFRGTPHSELPNGGLGDDPLVIASQIIREMANNDRTAKDALAKIRGETEDIIARLEHEGMTRLPGYEGSKKALVEIDKMAPEDFTRDKGLLYTVEIPEDGEYLLWDKPLSEQPGGIREKLAIFGFQDRDIAAEERLFEKAKREGVDPTELPEYAALTKKMDDGKAMREMTGEEFYRDLANHKRELAITKGDNANTTAQATEKAASIDLLESGIKGIKFLDGVSRADGDGSFNYVIFDGADVAITEYNQPGKESRRGSIKFNKGAGQGRAFTINLFRAADVSTFLHESGHLFLEMFGDLAADPKANPELVADWQRILDWLGAKDAASITEDQHETFARGFERYLMEGKAPASHLREAFARLKAWMVAIYKSVANLKVELAPEIRGVFDRLVAAEDAVDQAEAQHGAASLPRETFATDEEFARYQQAEQASRQASRDRLEGELLEDFQARRQAELDAQRAEVQADVEREIDARPVYQVMSALQRGQLPDGTRLPDEFQGMKLDKDDLVAQWGETTLSKLPGPGRKANAGPHVYAVEGGLPVDQVARSWGFPSGDAMVEALIQADDRASLIQTTTDKRMRELNPDAMDNLAERANAALATDQRAELFRRELSALGRHTGQTPAPIEVLRQVARDQIAEEPVHKIAPDKFRVAAGKAARRVVDAVSRQQWDDAYRAKTQEALNLELYRAARDAKEASETGRAYLRRFDTLAGRERMGKAGGGIWTLYAPDGEQVGTFEKEEDAREAWTKQPQGATYKRTNGYMEQIETILDGFQLRRASNLSLRRRDAFRAWLERQQADGEPVDIDPSVINDLGNRNWNDLTPEQQAHVVDAVRNVEKLAQLKNRLLKAKRKRELDQAREEIIGTIVTNQPKELDEGQTDGLLGKIWGKILGFFESHRKDSFLARRMDGDVDGGPVWDYFIRSRNEAAGEQESRSAEESVKLAALFKAWGKGAGAFRQEIPGTKLRMTTEQRIAVALNWGSKEGRQRVMAWMRRSGSGLDDAQAILDSLDKKDWALVNGVVAQINAHWSDVAALEQNTKGIIPEKVQALPFVTKEGVQPGGYYPIKYDIEKSNKAGNLQAQIEAKDMLRGANAQTRRGHTKLRAMNVDDMALRFDFGVIGEHLSEVVHDLTHREMLLDQNRLFKDPEISKAIRTRYGQRALNQLINTATDIAVGDAPARNAAEKLLKFFRINNSAAAFGANLTSALMNLTGISQSLTRVDPRYLAQAHARLFRSPDELNNGFRFATSKSELMANRSRTMLREIADATRAVQPGGKMAAFRQGAYWPMMQVQRVVDTITWLGAYEQSLAKSEKAGKNGAEAEDLAVAIADQTVVDTQGSGRIGDLAAMQRGGEISKLWTAFYSYFSTAANLQGSAIRRVYQKPGNAAMWGRLVGDTLAVWTLPALLGSLIKSGLQGDERDEEEWWKDHAKEQASYGMGMLVGLREFGSTIEGRFGYSGPAGLRGLTATVKATGELIDDDFGSGDAKALSNLAGVFTGSPSVQINRLIDAVAKDAANGNEGAALRRALFGAPRK